MEPGYTLAQQQRLAAALAHSDLLGAAPVETIETHISWVFLCGDYAFKLKKALDLGFLNYANLQRRQLCGEEELRLNRRTAPDLYLDLIAITGAPDHPSFGEPAHDYLVRMRRFPAGSLLAERLAAGEEIAPHLDRLTRHLAHFHQQAAVAPAAYGSPAQARYPVVQNFAQIEERLPTLRARLAPQQAWAEQRFHTLQPLMEQRRLAGRIRECHGDLHLGNIALIGDEPVPFDGIEFNPELRYIDVMSELAFLTMDLADRGRTDLAARVINGYLEQTGDYRGLPLLPWYQAYRAMVRAKVSAIRLGQEGLAAAEQQSLERQCDGYLDLAASYAQPRSPALLITHGPSGSGKSTLTLPLLCQMQAIRLRSDVERKRLFGLAPEAASGSTLAEGIYTAVATQRTYNQLLQLAAEVLAAGYPVIVDATFATAEQRAPFQQLASQQGVPFRILHCHAAAEELYRRVTARQAMAGEASEADGAVLDRQLTQWQPLTAQEQHLTIDMGQADPHSALVRSLATP